MKTAAVALMIPAQKTRPLKVSRVYLNGLAPAEIETVLFGSSADILSKNFDVRSFAIADIRGRNAIGTPTLAAPTRKDRRFFANANIVTSSKGNRFGR
jgi:hypothetical protein